MTPEQRKLRASLAANNRWKRATVAERVAATEAARKARQEAYERQVDPDGILDPDDRRRMAKNAEREHCARMAYLRHARNAGEAVA